MIEITETTQTLLSSLKGVPITALALLFMGGMAFTLILQAGISLFRFFRSKKDSDKFHLLSVKPSDDLATIRMTKTTLEKLALSKEVGSRIRIMSSPEKGLSRKAIENLSYRQNNGELAHDTIEIPQRTFRKLYGDKDLSAQYKFRFEPIELKGFAEYWFDPDDRTRFANRFAIGIGLAFLTTEVVAGLIL